MECPKCGSKSARLEDDGTDVTIKCFCGINRVIATRLGEMEITHQEKPARIKIPAKGSKLYQAFYALQTLQEADTTEIRDRIDLLFDNDLLTKDVASQLTVLKHRALIEVIEYRRGVAGGSIWKLTDDALRIWKGK